MTGEAEPQPATAPPEAFELRGRPRTARRVNRKLIAGVVLLTVSLIAALIVFALRPVRLLMPEARALIDAASKLSLKA
jgi:hypothetical protein